MFKIDSISGNDTQVSYQIYGGTPENLAPRQIGENLGPQGARCLVSLNGGLITLEDIGTSGAPSGMSAVRVNGVGTVYCTDGAGVSIRVDGGGSADVRGNAGPVTVRLRGVGNPEVRSQPDDKSCGIIVQPLSGNGTVMFSTGPAAAAVTVFLRFPLDQDFVDGIGFEINRSDGVIVNASTPTSDDIEVFARNGDLVYARLPEAGAKDWTINVRNPRFIGCNLIAEIASFAPERDRAFYSALPVDARATLDELRIHPEPDEATPGSNDTASIGFDLDTPAFNTLRVTSAPNDSQAGAVLTTNAAQREPPGFLNGLGTAVPWGGPSRAFIVHNAGAAQAAGQRYALLQLTSASPLRLFGVRFRSYTNGAEGEGIPLMVAVEASAREDFADATVLGSLPTYGGYANSNELAVDLRLPAGTTNIRLRVTSPMADGKTFIAYRDVGVATSPLPGRQLSPERIAFDFNQAPLNALEVACAPNDLQANAVFTTNALQQEPGGLVNGVSSLGPNGNGFILHNIGTSRGSAQRYASMRLSSATPLHLYGLRFRSYTNAAGSSIADPVIVAIEGGPWEDFTEELGRVPVFGGDPTEKLLPLDLRVPIPAAPLYIRLRATASIPDGSNQITYADVAVAAQSVESSDLLVSIEGGRHRWYPQEPVPVPLVPVRVGPQQQAWTAQPFDAKRPWAGIALCCHGLYLTRRQAGAPDGLTVSPFLADAARLLPQRVDESRWLFRLFDDPGLALTFRMDAVILRFEPLQAADAATVFQRLTVVGEMPGQRVVRPPARFMPSAKHIMSVTAAADASVLHLIVTVMQGEDDRALWHAQQQSGSAEVTWSNVAGGREFPVMEAEFVLHDDGSLSIFALDEFGWAYMRHPDSEWSPPKWNGQPVPFTDLTASYERGVYAIYGLDDDGALWCARFAASTWGGWETIQATIRPIFTDISSAAGYIAGTDAFGAIWVLPPQDNVWQVIRPPAGTAFALVDVSWNVARRAATLWAVDGLGAVWSGQFAAAAGSAAILRPFGSACPVPITGDFCAVEQGDDARVWGVAHLTQLWAGRQGDTLWDGPTWGGLRLSAAMPIFAFASFTREVDGQQMLAVSAVAAAQSSGTAIWTGELDDSAQPPAWNLWYARSTPASTTRIVGLAAPHSGATRLWAIDAAGGLFWSSLNADGALAWTAATTASVRRIAAARLPSDDEARSRGKEALWVARDDGTVEQTDSAGGFATFQALAEIKARAIGVASAVSGGKRRTVALALDREGAPFELAFKTDGTFTKRAPAFGFPAPTVKLVAVEMDTWSNGTRLRAIALDVAGWLWAASETSSDAWGTAWEGPRWKRQPARFRAIQASGETLLALDTAGTLWMFDSREGGWRGPDWGGAANLSAWGSPAPVAPLIAMAAHSAANTKLYSEVRKGTIYESPAGSGEYSFNLDDHANTTVIRAVWDGAAVGGTYFVRGPDDVMFPNEATRVFYFDRQRRLPIGYWMALALPIMEQVQAWAGGRYTVYVDKNQNNAKLNVWYHARTRVLVPQGRRIAPGSRVWRLKIKPLLIFQSQESAARKAENRQLLNNAIPLIKGLLSNFGITAEIPATIPEWDYQDIPTTDFRRGVTRQILSARGEDHAANIIFCSVFQRTGDYLNESIQAICGSSPGVYGPEDNEKLHFGIIIPLQQLPWSRRNLTSPNSVSLNVCHEIGHLLGLSHESSGSDRDNLMRDSPGAYGSNLLPAQLFIVQNAVLVSEEASLAPPPSPKVDLIRLTIHTGSETGLFDGSGTDGHVTFSILRGGTAPALYSERLDAVDDRRHFKANSQEEFELRPEPFSPSESSAVKIGFESTSWFFTDTWLLRRMDMRAFAGKTLVAYWWHGQHEFESGTALEWTWPTKKESGSAEI